MSPEQLSIRIPTAAIAFRGYNVTNLGRSPELLAHPAYGPIVAECLSEASSVCADVVRRDVDLVERVRDRRETTLETYDEAVALIMAMQRAQLRLLHEHFGIDFRAAKASFGYSLGEITAVAMGGVVELHDAMRVPLALAADSAKLAKDVTLGVLFSRGQPLPFESVRRLCQEINQQGEGVVGISTHLSPNSVLLMGQGDTLGRFAERMRTSIAKPIYLRKHSGDFPPLHTPIVWQCCIPNRAAVLMHTLPGGFTAPKPPVLSMVTGKASYTDGNARELLHDWVDHPQRLWDVVYETLTSGIHTIVHVGPEPNIIPATYKRLHDNVQAELSGRIGMRALTAVVRHPWLKAVLPQRTALLRAPQIEQVVLEDWLLAQAEPANGKGIAIESYSATSADRARIA